MVKKCEELHELIGLVNKFLDFANDLKEEGKITNEQYLSMTKSKIDFLDSIEKKSSYREVIPFQENLFA